MPTSPLILFSPEDRLSIINQAERFAVSSPLIRGTMLVGSGSYGFNDDLSDVDIVFVVEDSQYDAAFNHVAGFIDSLSTKFSTRYQHRADVNVFSVLLGNYLEVDIGVWAIKTLFASGSHWQIIQSKDEDAKHRIAEAMKSNSHLGRKGEPVISGDDPLWQFVFSAYMAKRRGKAEKFERYKKLLEGRLEPNLTEQELYQKLDIIYSGTRSSFLKDFIESSLKREF